MEKRKLSLNCDIEVTTFQRIVGLINRNKIRSSCLEYKTNEQSNMASIVATLEAPTQSLDRLLSQLKATVDVYQVNLSDI